MKSYLSPLLSALLLTPASMLADGNTVWCLVADRQTIVPLSEVQCLLTTDASDRMSVLTSGTTLTGVGRVTFRSVPVSGLSTPSVSIPGEPDVIVGSDRLTVTGLDRAVGPVLVRALDGTILRSVGNPTGASVIEVPITTLPTGVYILSVGGRAVKFAKK
ncbi:MAG: hypothetical protein NC212_04270 [Staphylococcus sp.]|nr:hypothetical protein [Staphylococcus sp.]